MSDWVAVSFTIALLVRYVVLFITDVSFPMFPIWVSKVYLHCWLGDVRCLVSPLLPVFLRILVLRCFFSVLSLFLMCGVSSGRFLFLLPLLGDACFFICFGSSLGLSAWGCQGIVLIVQVSGGVLFCFSLFLRILSSPRDFLHGVFSADFGFWLVLGFLFFPCPLSCFGRFPVCLFSCGVFFCLFAIVS